MIINLWLLKLSPASTWRQCYLPLPTPSLTFPRSSQFGCILYWSIESVKQQYYKLLYKSLYFFTLHMCSCSFSHVRNLTHSYLEAKLITQLFSWILYNSPSTVERKSTASPPSGFPPASLICLRSSSEDVESDKNKRFLRIHIMLYLEIVHSSKIFHNFTFGNSSFVSLSWFKWFFHKFQLFIGFWKGI